MQYSDLSEFLGEPSDICAVESLQMLCDLKHSTSKAGKTFSWMYFRSAQFPTAGWSTGVQFQVARLFPEREQAGVLGAIPGHSRIS